MQARRSQTAVLVPLLSTALLAAALPLAGEKLRNHFDSDAPLNAPAFFDLLVLGAPGEADWKVVGDLDPPSPPNQLTQTRDGRPEGSIAVAVRRNSNSRDGTWSVALKRGLGRGGIVFRLADEKDFLFVWIDTTSGEARLVSYRGGKPQELARRKADWSSRWGFLAVTAKDAAISATWEGKPLLEAVDPHPLAGRAGLGTLGPGITSFDEFVLEGLREPGNGER